MAHVLLPTDFSDNALNASLFALRLFGDKGNTFTAVHSYAPALNVEAEAFLVETAASVAMEQTGAFTERIKTALPGRKPVLESACGPGSLSAVIRDARTGEPDLVVMGTQGSSGLKATLMGNHTVEVIRHTDLAVLAVPEQARYRIPKRIVLADDGGPVDKAMLKVLLDIARWSRSEVMIVGTTDEETNSEHGSTATAYDLLLGGIPHTHQYLSGENVHDALNDLADQSDADLVALPHRPRGSFQHLFQNSPATKLVMHTHVPMLVLRPPNG
ncbi:MAG: universal stress protein [Flavobacteriales bacterium]